MQGQNTIPKVTSSRSLSRLDEGRPRRDASIALSFTAPPLSEPHEETLQAVASRDYADVPLDELGEIAARAQRRLILEAVRAGLALIEARNRHKTTGTFIEWLDTTSVARSTAYYYMNVARDFDVVAKSLPEPFPALETYSARKLMAEAKMLKTSTSRRKSSRRGRPRANHVCCEHVPALQAEIARLAEENRQLKQPEPVHGGKAPRMGGWLA